MRNTSLEVLEGRIGYHFKDIYLLECALTHTSFANEQKIHRYKDYERLEFLGDAVLEMVSSAFLYNEYPDKREGELTKIRASLVCEPSLADCARHLGLPGLLRLGRGEEASGGREKESILCDVVEAVIGANPCFRNGHRDLAGRCAMNSSERAVPSTARPIRPESFSATSSLEQERAAPKKRRSSRLLMPG